MKKLIFLAFALVCFMAACNNKLGNGSSSTDSTGNETEVADASEAAVMKFAQMEYNFGTINEGEKVTHEYAFTNTGKNPLIISQALASCGCTVPEYPKQPIAPGKGGVIKVVFNSTAKFGKQNKAITISSNAVPSTSTLYLIGEVKEVKH
ncbi:MAG: hypothetical protein K0S09_2416 [Sphingobacteriaceae bacterium]|jgi:hypothetical protein|nr:hypothetical protein [Sphingobacteriaceae bacterium]